jgi:hypothetical protein
VFQFHVNSRTANVDVWELHNLTSDIGILIVGSTWRVSILWASTKISTTFFFGVGVILIVDCDMSFGGIGPGGFVPQRSVASLVSWEIKFHHLNEVETITVFPHLVFSHRLC